MLLIFGDGARLDPFVRRPEGAHSTTTFLRRIATASALAGRLRSARATAMSAFELVNAAMLSAAFSVTTGDRRTGL